MREEAVNRIHRETADLPERWQDVLKSALLDSEFPTEADLLIESAVAVHSKYPAHMEPAEAILAGDAFIPMAIESLLDTGASPDEIEEFLSKAVGKFDK